MRAVKKFKQLMSRHRCRTGSDHFLDDPPRLVQPPGEMSPGPATPAPPHVDGRHDHLRGSDVGTGDGPAGPFSVPVPATVRLGHRPHEDEPTLLNVGPGQPQTGALDMVSESPTGVDFDIYDAAYRQEVERIHDARGRSTTVFLTQRVEGDGDVGAHSRGERARVRWGALLNRPSAT